MEEFLSILEVIKWPASIFVSIIFISLSFFVIFKKSISKKIDLIKRGKISRKGLDIEIDQPTPETSPGLPTNHPQISIKDITEFIEGVKKSNSDATAAKENFLRVFRILEDYIYKYANIYLVPVSKKILSSLYNINNGDPILIEDFKKVWEPIIGIDGIKISLEALGETNMAWVDAEKIYLTSFAKDFLKLLKDSGQIPVISGPKNPGVIR